MHMRSSFLYAIILITVGWSNACHHHFSKSSSNIGEMTTTTAKVEPVRPEITTPVPKTPVEENKDLQTTAAPDSTTLSAKEEEETTTAMPGEAISVTEATTTSFAEVPGDSVPVEGEDLETTVAPESEEEVESTTANPEDPFQDSEDTTTLLPDSDSESTVTPEPEEPSEEKFETTIHPEDPFQESEDTTTHLPDSGSEKTETPEPEEPSEEQFETTVHPVDPSNESEDTTTSSPGAKSDNIRAPEPEKLEEDESEMTTTPEYPNTTTDPGLEDSTEEVDINPSDQTELTTTASSCGPACVGFNSETTPSIPSDSQESAYETSTEKKPCPGATGGPVDMTGGNDDCDN